MDLIQDNTIYDKKADYAKDNLVMLSAYVKRIIDILWDERGTNCTSRMSLLELGIGHGYTTKIFNGFFESHTVIDGDQEIVDKFTINNPNVRVDVVCSFFEDFDSGKQYDVIVAGFVLEHVDNPEFILEKFKKFLKPQGTIFVAVPNALCLHRRIGHEAGLLGDMYQLSGADLRLGHKRYFDVNTISNQCKKVGLEIQRIEGVYLKPLTYSQMNSLNLSDGIYDALCKVAKDYPELSSGILLECKAGVN